MPESSRLSTSAWPMLPMAYRADVRAGAGFPLVAGAAAGRLARTIASRLRAAAVSCSRAGSLGTVKAGRLNRTAVGCTATAGVRGLRTVTLPQFGHVDTVTETGRPEIVAVLVCCRISISSSQHGQ